MPSALRPLLTKRLGAAGAWPQCGWARTTSRAGVGHQVGADGAGFVAEIVDVSAGQEEVASADHELGGDPLGVTAIALRELRLCGFGACPALVVLLLPAAFGTRLGWLVRLCGL